MKTFEEVAVSAETLAATLEAGDYRDTGVARFRGRAYILPAVVGRLLGVGEAIQAIYFPDRLGPVRVERAIRVLRRLVETGAVDWKVS